MIAKFLDSFYGRKLSSLRRRTPKACDNCHEEVEMLAFQRFCSAPCRDKWHGQRRKHKRAR